MAEAGNSIGGWILSYLAARADRYDTVPGTRGTIHIVGLNIGPGSYFYEI